ncbi:hypothetical protein L596_007798 [Steinernema carpocapsae]|uniref:Uncharacterized protein n=1 Tax=Steinernema carpocapsae TaxID=34508 RepID=A0A4U5PAJ4_STECR|nr:hypothetical protein L596_007798 [Steinernema carpocapsae]
MASADVIGNLQQNCEAIPPGLSNEGEHAEDGDSRRSDAACVCMIASAVIFALSLLTALGAAIALSLHLPWGEENEANT